MKIGILGCGRIAQKMGNTLKLMGLNKECYIASRDINKAIQFKEEYDFAGFYGNYDDLINNKEIELIYIATINSLHYEHAKLCLENGKNVLLEKPITLRLNEAKALYDLAEDKDLYIGEALWTAYMPSLKIIQSYINKYFKNITSSLAVFKVNSIVKERVNRKDLGGGALFDLGIYPITITLLTCGFNYNALLIKNIEYSNEVDIKEEFGFAYDNFFAKCIVDATYNRESYLKIQNDDYLMEVSPIECPKEIKIFQGDQLIINEDISPKLTGFEYEILESIDCIKNKKNYPSSWNKDKSLKTLDIMTNIIHF